MPETTSPTAHHLDLLGIFSYIFAGFMALGGCVPIIHFGMGLAILLGAFTEETQGQPPPPILGGFVMAFAGCIMAFAWAVAILSALAGSALRSRRRYTLCFAAAVVQCMFIPLGTVLGVFSIIVLARPEAKALFDAMPDEASPLSA
ncbi:MAG: hypothetical protein AAF823_00305 [Planctomycetota bacterium]